jgi:hypothetical protein
MFVNPNPRYVVDGHEAKNKESCLAGDGQFPPFRVLDTDAQNYLPGTYKTRAEAEKAAARALHYKPLKDELLEFDDELQRVAKSCKWLLLETSDNGLKGELAALLESVRSMSNRLPPMIDTAPTYSDLEG